ncbi:MAG: transglutaminase domain-containing protein [Muribaculaceae bacterium]|nr:transglutaminase domain-containing protein [Muribaculaceae bacterium]
MKPNKFIVSLVSVIAISLSSSTASNSPVRNGQIPSVNETAEETKAKAIDSYEEFKRRVQAEYKSHQDEAVSRYLAFRDSVLSEFVKHMHRPWEKYDGKPAVPKPIDKSIEPEIVPIDKDVVKKDNVPQDNTPTVKPVEEEIAEQPKIDTPAPEPVVEPEPTPVPEPVVEPEPAPAPEPVIEPEPTPAPEPKVETPKPQDKPVKEDKPKIKREQPKTAPIDNSIYALKVKDAIEVPNININVRPVPFVPVIVPSEETPDIFEFTFFGTPLSVRLDDSCNFTLASIDNKGIATAMEEITKNDLINVTLGDCLDIRKELKLCDWAYLEMLMELSNAYYGGDCNEATLLTGYLFCMSGYKMRYAYNQNKELIILFASDQFITDLPFLSMPSDGYRNYYALGGKDSSKIHVCDFAFPNEKCLSLYVPEVPLFASNNADINFKLHSYPINLNYSINKNLIDFYETYPTPLTENDAYSKWIYYARTPLSDQAKEAIYPVIKKAIEGKSEYAAVNIIMDWVETYKYGYDDKVWGYDRAFFPDETIFYPSSDCEDHAILFTRLVTDLIGLKTALIYYPGHLAAAVQFNGDVAGDYIEYKGAKYTVCDPTIYYGKAGRTMRGVSNDQATIIIL